MATDALLESGSPWWAEKTKTKALSPLLAIYKYFVSEDAPRLQAYNAYSRIYLNRDIANSDYLANYSAAWNVEDNAYSRVPVNVAKVMVDSAHAKVTRQNPRPVFVTHAGNHTLEKKARQMQNWVEFCEHLGDVRPIKRSAALDGFIYGTGLVKTAAHPVVDEVENTRIHPADVFIDPVEAASNGRPSHLYQRAFVSRSRLAAMYQKHKEAIRTAGRISEDPYVWHRQRHTLANMVEVIEAWRLPSFEGAGDGKHAIAIDGALLELEDYEDCTFPFSVYRWKEDPTVGFWGISLIEELLGLHFDFNHTIRNIEECIDSMPTPFILIPEGGNVSEGKLGNVNGIVINYADQRPTFELPPSVPADVVAYASTIWEKALQVSRLLSLSMPESTGGQFETGQAVRDYNDIQATELAPQYEEFERFNVKIYEAQVRAGRKIYKRNPAFTVVMRKDKYTIEGIDWKEIDDPRKDSFVIQVFPASSLSQTPAGKKSDVLDFFNAGWLDSGEAMALLDFPDLDQYKSLRNAARDNVKRILEQMLDEGIYEAPEPTLDIRLSMKMTQMFINRAQAMRVPEERISLLRRFMRQLKSLNDQAEEATLLRAQGMGSLPAGGPPPVSPDGSSPTAI